MTALEQNRRGPQCQKRLRRSVQGLCIRNIAPQKQLRFVQIGRDHRNPWEQFAHQNLHRLLCNQAVTTGGHHHRVQHHMVNVVMVNGPSHHIDNGRLVQHADLQGIDPDVIHDRLNLRLQKRGGHGMDALHAYGVLGRESGDRAHAITTQSGKSFQVGLNACPTTAVRSSNGEHACITFMVVHARNYPRSNLGDMT